MRLHKTLFLGLLLAASVELIAQQTPRLTQYYDNEFFFNPAGSNLDNNLQATIGYRKEWMNIQDSPRTLLVNFSADLDRLTGREVQRFKRKNYRIKSTSRIRKVRDTPKQMVGFKLFSDKFGLFETTTFNLTYAAHIPISEEIILSGGVGAGFRQFNFDSGRAVISDSGDPTFNNFLVLAEQKYSFDLNAGLMLYSEKFRLGYSINELSNRILGVDDMPSNIVSRDAASIQHIFLGSYRFDVNEQFDLIPNFLAMHQQFTPFLLNVGVRATYNDQFWFSTLYRSAHALAIGTGFSYQRFINIGYSYDIAFGRYGGLGNGSHEIVVGIRLN